MAGVIHGKHEIDGNEIPLQRLPMGRDRKGKAANWTSKKKEHRIAEHINEGKLCAHCLKPFEKGEERVKARENSELEFHVECREKSKHFPFEWEKKDRGILLTPRWRP
jgi:hypothetical protein